MISTTFIAILIIASVGYLVGRWRASRLTVEPGSKLHSQPSYHGAFIAAWAGLPAFFLVLLWLLFQSSIIDALIVAQLPSEKIAGLTDVEIGLILSEIRSIASGNVFGDPDQVIIDAGATYRRWQGLSSWIMLAAAVCLALAAFGLTNMKITPRFRARHKVERIVNWLMIFCAAIAIFTTIGIIVSLVYESIAFFRQVPIMSFLFGLNWEPQIAIRSDQVAGDGAFGAIPVFAGTLLISFIAMLIAVPVGLLSAIYLTEFSGERFRAFAKPALEILAGVPTVVYGFFAVLVIAPAIRQFGQQIGLDIAPNSALAAGLVMGIMIIPFISSLSDDAINAVPLSMREGSLAMGATRSETVLNVILPAAIPGIMGGILLGVSRAIGETMIVVMAAGLIARLTANPLESVTTVTVQIVTLLIGDTEFDNPKTLAAFALGLLLFLVTLVLNVAALWVVRKYREQYD